MTCPNLVRHEKKTDGKESKHDGRNTYATVLGQIMGVITQVEVMTTRK
jgi:hypothetical protein